MHFYFTFAIVFNFRLSFMTLPLVIYFFFFIFEYNNNDLRHEFAPRRRVHRWSICLRFALCAALLSEFNRCRRFVDLPIRLGEMVISFWRIVISIMTPAAAPSYTDLPSSYIKLLSLRISDLCR